MPIRVLVGYDGSPAANAAVSAGARLFPHARAWIAQLWTPPFASDPLRQRLWTGAGHVNEFVEAVEREGAHEAERIAATGVTLARAAGWDAEPLTVRCFAGEGVQLAELAERLDADLVLVGSRGLGGARAVLGSVSDMVVHYAMRPVLVVPYPLLSAEDAALDAGLVLIASDNSAGSRMAYEAAARLFPARRLQSVTVDDGQDWHDETGNAQVSDAATAQLRIPDRHGPHGRAFAGALAECARHQAAAVLVVGSRGRSAAQEILLGSVAMATLHHAHRPVLVVAAASHSAQRQPPGTAERADELPDSRALRAEEFACGRDRVSCGGADRSE